MAPRNLKNQWRTRGNENRLIISFSKVLLAIHRFFAIRVSLARKTEWKSAMADRLILLEDPLPIKDYFFEIDPALTFQTFPMGCLSSRIFTYLNSIFHRIPRKRCKCVCLSRSSSLLSTRQLIAPPLKKHHFWLATSYKENLWVLPAPP